VRFSFESHTQWYVETVLYGLYCIPGNTKPAIILSQELQQFWILNYAVLKNLIISRTWSRNCPSVESWAIAPKQTHL